MTYSWGTLRMRTLRAPLRRRSAPYGKRNCGSYLSTSKLQAARWPCRHRQQQEVDLCSSLPAFAKENPAGMDEDERACD